MWSGFGQRSSALPKSVSATSPSRFVNADTPVAGPSGDAVKVFISYSHADEKYRRDFEKHVAILQRQGKFAGWHDREIRPGNVWAGVISGHLDDAQVVILLISPDFVASRYCWDVEMKRALEKHELGEAVVVPIVIRPTDYEGAPFESLQMLPTDARPVSAWKDPDEAWVDVVKGIRRVCQGFTQATDANP
jgi:hypothetical protein